MNLVALLIAPAVVTYADSPAIRIGITVLAVGIVVAAVVISKRRSASIAPTEESNSDRAPEPVSS